MPMEHVPPPLRSPLIQIIPVGCVMFNQREIVGMFRIYSGIRATPDARRCDGLGPAVAEERMNSRSMPDDFEQTPIAMRTAF